MRWSQAVLVVGMLACAGPSTQVQRSGATRAEAVPTAAMLTVLAKDAGGRPLPDIGFQLRRAVAERPEGLWGTTDEHGQSQLRVPSGWYVLTAQPSGYQAFVDPDVRHGSEHPQTVTMTLQPAVAVEGLVVDDARKPISDVSLSWIPADETAPRLDVVGKPDGRFLFDGMGPGRGVLLVRRKGYSDERRVFEAPPADLTLVLREQGTLRVRALLPDGSPKRAPEVEVKALDPVSKHRAWVDASDKDARVYRGVEAGRYRVTFVHPLGEFSKWTVQSEVTVEAGRIRDLDIGFKGLTERSPLRGRLVGGDGRPLSNVGIGAFSGDATQDAFASETWGRTDADGRFALEHLLEGPLRVEINAGKAKVELDAGAKDASLRFDFRPTVEGRVVGPDGKPLRRFSVDWRTFESPEGRYEIALEGTWPRTLPFAAEGFVTTHITVTPRAERTVLPDIVLDVGRTVRGRIVREDGKTATPLIPVALIAPWDMEAFLAGSTMTTTADAEGRFVLEHVPRESMILQASNDLGGTVARPLGVEEDAVSLRLVPDTTAVGTVADEKGRPLEGVGLRSWCEGRFGASDESDAEGRFSLRSPGGGECVVKVTPNELRSVWPMPPRRNFWPLRFKGRPGETIPVHLRLRTGPASVHVSFPDAGEWHQVVLVQGDVPVPSTAQAMNRLILDAIDPEAESAERRPERRRGDDGLIIFSGMRDNHFSSLPLGRYTVFVFENRIGFVVRRYPLNLTSPGVHSFEVSRLFEEGAVYLSP